MFLFFKNILILIDYETSNKTLNRKKYVKNNKNVNKSDECRMDSDNELKFFFINFIICETI